jgi:hypothetical protein
MSGRRRWRIKATEQLFEPLRVVSESLKPTSFGCPSNFSMTSSGMGTFVVMGML